MYYERKKWQKTPYTKSLDYYLAKEINKITNFNTLDIVVWYAKKGQKKFDYFLFHYKGKYYELNNNKLSEISKNQILKKT